MPLSTGMAVGQRGPPQNAQKVKTKLGPTNEFAWVTQSQDPASQACRAVHCGEWVGRLTSAFLSLSELYLQPPLLRAGVT